MKFFKGFTLLIGFGILSSSLLGAEFPPSMFSPNGSFGSPSEDPNTVEYINYKMKPDLSNLPGSTFQQRKQIAAKQIWNELEVPEGQRVTGDVLKAKLEGKELVDGQIPEPEVDHSIPGISTPIETANAKIGPVMLREKIEDFGEGNLDKITGATASFTRNRLSDVDTWASKGTLMYPLDFSDDTEFYIIPAVTWNLKDVSGSSGSDIEEITFQAPLTAEFEGPVGGSIAINTWQAFLTPSYLTDLDFDGGAIGASLSLEPFLQFGRTPNFHDPNLSEDQRYSGFNIGDFRSLFGTRGAGYLIRIIPRIEYSNVVSTSEFIRGGSDDSLFGLGSAFELGIRPFGVNTPWEFRAGYSFLYDFNGVDKYADLWTLKGLWWLNKNVGFSVEFQDGVTPVAQEDIDQILVGLEVKF